MPCFLFDEINSFAACIYGIAVDTIEPCQTGTGDKCAVTVAVGFDVQMLHRPYIAY